MVQVKFYGDLKRFADGPIELEVSNFKELTSGLFTQIKGLRQHISKGYYKIRVGSKYLSEEQIKTTPIIDLKDGCTVHFTPVVAGAGKGGGVLQMIAGAVLIAIAYINPFGYLSGPIVTAMYAAGVSMAISGAISMLAKPPAMTDPGSLKNGDAGEKKQSTSFSNIRNLTPQGRPVPLLYGKMLTSLVLISQGIETFDDVSALDQLASNKNQAGDAGKPKPNPKRWYAYRDNTSQNDNGDNNNNSSGSHTPYEAPDSLRSAQKLRAIGLISLGPIKGPANKWEDTFFDNTPIKSKGSSNGDLSSFNFVNTEIQFNLGYQNQPPLTGFNESEREVSVSTEIKQQHPITRSVTDPDVTRLRITMGVNALFSQNEKGETHGSEVDFQVLINGSVRGQYKISGKSSSRFYRSYIISNLPPRPFTVTIKRLTEDSKSQRLQNGTHWVSYTEIIDTRLSYPNMALVGVKIDSRYVQNFPNMNFLLHGRIIKIPTTYNPDTRKYDPGLWRGDFKLDWTNNPAWIFYDIITNDLAGLGKRIGDFGVDKFTLYEIAKYCDELVDDGYGGKEPRMVSNLWLTLQRDAYNVISDMASVFRSIAAWDGTQFTSVQDRPGDPVCLYTQSNVVDGKFVRQYAAGKAIFTAVEVEYADERNMYQRAIEYVSNDSMIARYGYNVKKITAYGCTSRGQAHRYGQWVLETSRLEQCTITFAVGRQGLMHLPGDIIEVADNNYAGKVIGGRVIAVDGRKVTLDQPVEIVGEGYLNYISSTGLVKIKVSSVDDDNPAIITLESEPQELDILDNWVLKSGIVSTQLYRALGITENENGSYTITALQHEPQKEAIVDKSANFVPVATTTHSSGVTKPANADISFGDGGVKVTWTTSTSVGPVKYDIKLYRNGNLYSTHLDLDSPEITFENLPDGSYSVEIRSKNSAGQLSDPVVRTFEISLNIPRFVTKSLLFAVELDWDLPKTATIGNYTEVWRSETNDLEKAIKIATLSYPQNNYIVSGVGINQEYYFWLRCGDKNNNKGEFTEAVFGEPERNPESLLNMVEEAVAKVGIGRELIASLKTELSGSISEETKARIAAVNSVIQQLNNQAAVTGTAIQKLEKADKSQAEAIKTVTAKAESALSGITAEQKARADGDKAEAQARSALAGRVAAAESGISSLRETVTQQDDARATEIRTLSAKVDGVASGGRNYALLTGSQDKTLTVNGNNQTKTINIDVSPSLTLKQGDALVISCDIDVSNATSTYGKPYPRIGAELSVVYDDNSVGYFSVWYDEAVNGVKKTLKQRIEAKHTIAKAVKSIRNIIVQARYQTSDNIKVSNVKLERGTAATDWSPAPEDSATGIAKISADLTSYQQAQATKENAQSQKMSELTARVGGAEATVSQMSNTVTGINGKISSMHTIKTQTISGGRKAIAGIALGANETESSVIVMADKFGIVANANDSNVKQVFSVANGLVGIRGDLVVAGTVTRDKLSSGGGGNILYNPIFANNAYGWFAFGGKIGDWTGCPSVSPESKEYSIRDWHPKGEKNECWRVIRLDGTAEQFNTVANRRASVDVFRKFENVRAGGWYIASIYVGADNCAGSLIIESYSANSEVFNGSIGETVLAGSDNVEGKPNNFEVAESIKFQKGLGFDAKRIFVKFRAPETGRILLLVRVNRYAKNKTYAEYYCARPMLEECTEHTTEPSPWVNAGLTEVHGGSIVANTIRGEHIIANQTIRAPKIEGGEIDISGNDGILRVGRSGNFLVRASSYNRGLVMNNNQFIVYDENGRVRVLIGKLA